MRLIVLLQWVSLEGPPMGFLGKMLHNNSEFTQLVLKEAGKESESGGRFFFFSSQLMFQL